MEEIKQAVLILLRQGKNLTSIQEDLARVSGELKLASMYMQAIKESDQRP